MPITVRQHSFIQDVTVTPTTATFCTINKPLSQYSVTCTLKQTTFIVSSSYDEHGKPTRPSLLLDAKESQPSLSLPMRYAPSCKTTMEIMHMCLKAFLEVITKKPAVYTADAVINRLLHDTRINNGYYNSRSSSSSPAALVQHINGRPKQVWPQFMWLNVTINLVNVNHICVPPKTTLCSLKPKIVEDDDCSICLEKLDYNDNNGGQELISLCCDHVFHQSCVLKWLVASHRQGGALNCPLCRRQCLS